MNDLAKFLRKLRINNDEILKDMANKLDISSAYLSAVENGRRNFPIEWLDILKSKYNLNEEQFEILKKAVDFSNKNVSINIEKLNNEKKEAALIFARKLEGYGDEETKKLIEYMKGLSK